MTRVSLKYAGGDSVHWLVYTSALSILPQERICPEVMTSVSVKCTEIDSLHFLKT